MLSRRVVGKGLLAMGAMSLAPASRARLHAAKPPRVIGPIAGGRRGHMFGGHADNLAALGIVEEEYFVSGMATSYRPDGELPIDGSWSVRPDRTAPFLTRVILQRPADLNAFNGTVICEWANVSAGYEIALSVNQQFFRDGFAFAAISAQPMGLIGDKGSGLGLNQWDPERYGELEIPGDAFSYDVFTQVARALGAKRPRRPVDPMGGLPVKRLFALGESQSAARLLAYINAVHRHAGVFDAFVPCVAVGSATTFGDFHYDPAKSMAENNEARRAMTVPTRLRTDQPAPVVVINSETETPFHHAVRQPDAAQLRTWEVVGTTHASAVGGQRRPDIFARDGVPDRFSRTARMVDMLAVIEAAMVGLNRWVDGGQSLPSFPPIEVDPATRQPLPDPFGNALGGVRLPEILVPAARFAPARSSAEGVLAPFDPATLRAIYPDDADYARRMREAAIWARDAGIILPRKADDYIARSGRGPVAVY